MIESLAARSRIRIEEDQLGRRRQRADRSSIGAGARHLLDEQGLLPWARRMSIAAKRP
jgi:hypothetical protein